MSETSKTLKALDPDVLKQLLEKSNWRASWILLFNWSVIMACFLAVTFWSYWWVWILASIVLAGRILGLAILMHDCSHNGFFRSKWANQYLGQWLCAAPALADINQYRNYHLKHHSTAGSDKDPDRPNYLQYPVSSKSMFRKVLRDLSGITGVKLLILLFKMNAGLVRYQLSYDASKKEDKVSPSKAVSNLVKNLYPAIIVHSLLAIIFKEAYLLFWLSWMTTYMLISRLRNASEHGATIDINDLNPLKNTRTTLAPWWQRFLMAPNYVNYHLEHHLLPTVPSYNLPRFHQCLKKHGVLKSATISNGYGQAISELLSF